MTAAPVLTTDAAFVVRSLVSVRCDRCAHWLRGPDMQPPATKNGEDYGMCDSGAMRLIAASQIVSRNPGGFHHREQLDDNDVGFNTAASFGCSKFMPWTAGPQEPLVETARDQVFLKRLAVKTGVPVQQVLAIVQATRLLDDEGEMPPMEQDPHP